jgi:hypothetical protein
MRVILELRYVALIHKALRSFEASHAILLFHINFSYDMMPFNSRWKSFFNNITGSRSGAVLAQSAYRLAYGLGDRGSVPGGGRDRICSLRHRVQTNTEAQPASCAVGIGGSAPSFKNGWE